MTIKLTRLEEKVRRIELFEQEEKQKMEEKIRKQNKLALTLEKAAKTGTNNFKCLTNSRNLDDKKIRLPFARLKQSSLH